MRTPKIRITAATSLHQHSCLAASPGFSQIAIWRSTARERRGGNRQPSDGKLKGARCAAVGSSRIAGTSSTSREVRKSTTACQFGQLTEPTPILAPRGSFHTLRRSPYLLRCHRLRRSWRSTARTSAILLAEVPCDSSCMTRTRRSRAHNRTGDEPLDVYDYAHRRARRPRRPMPDDRSTWTVTDDWPEEVPVTEAEIEVFEVWFGDLLSRAARRSPRHAS